MSECESVIPHNNTFSSYVGLLEAELQRRYDDIWSIKRLCNTAEGHEDGDEIDIVEDVRVSLDVAWSIVDQLRSALRSHAVRRRIQFGWPVVVYRCQICGEEHRHAAEIHHRICCCLSYDASAENDK